MAFPTIGKTGCSQQKQPPRKLGIAERAAVRYEKRMWSWLTTWWQQRRRALPEHLRAGLWGEEQAERFVRRLGWKILGRRVRIGRDELDLVARDGETLVFIEVKTRRSESFGRPFDAVDRGKRRSLSRAAIRYLKKLPTRPSFFRFDVLEVIGTPEAGAPRIRHIEKAFTLDPRYRVFW
jgi:putative endonuclease